MNPVARLFALTAVAGSLTLMAGAAWAGATLDRIHQSKVMNVATAANWPPQSFLGEDNTLKGFDIDVANEIGKRLGTQVAFVTPEYGIITAGRWASRWDLSVGSMTPPPSVAGCSTSRPSTITPLRLRRAQGRRREQHCRP